MLRAVARILSSRTLLALVLLGAFILGMVAMLMGSWRSLAVLAIYAVATVGPLTALEMKGKG